jgi:hypothetical protein
MKHGAVRKLTRAAAMSLFVLATASGMAGLGVLAASPAMAQPSGQAANPEGQGDGANNPGGGTAPAPSGPTDSVTKVVGGLLGGGV